MEGFSRLLAVLNIGLQVFSLVTCDRKPGVSRSGLGKWACHRCSHMGFCCREESNVEAMVPVRERYGSCKELSFPIAAGGGERPGVNFRRVQADSTMGCLGRWGFTRRSSPALHSFPVHQARLTAVMMDVLRLLCFRVLGAKSILYQFSVLVFVAVVVEAGTYGSRRWP